MNLRTLADFFEIGKRFVAMTKRFFSVQNNSIQRKRVGFEGGFSVRTGVANSNIGRVNICTRSPAGAKRDERENRIK